MRLLIASNNPHKAEEIEKILTEFDRVSLVRPRDLAEGIPDPEEDGATLEENAYIKAKVIHEATGIPVIADDTGLEVDALHGAPGVRSARYASENATYSDNCNRLIEELKGSKERIAKFRTVICYVDENRTLFSEGVVEGEISKKPKGKNGFGYDPIFNPRGFEKSFAEMDEKQKNSISHRGIALRNFLEVLRPYVSTIESEQSSE